MSVITGIRRASLMIALGGCLAGTAAAEVPVQVRSQDFEIQYEVTESAQPLESVHLWYTLDQGANWSLFGTDEDCHSPMTFQAPVEGDYGFYFVLKNSVGESSSDPMPGTKPQLVAFVDYTPPVVQLHELRQTTMLGQRVVQVRWTAVDTNLPPRPVEIFYQRPPEEVWHSITPEPLANTGRFDWRLAADDFGTIAVRLSVVDLGGHVVNSERKTTETPLPDAVRTSLSDARTTTSGDSSPAPNGIADVSKEARRLAASAYAEGMKLGELGQLHAGISRLREAVRLNPQLTDAFAEMGSLLYRLGEIDRSLAAYGIALEQQPAMRRALQGQAKVQRMKNDYSAAAKSLRTILRYNPNDAEVWMNLGDIAIYQGDEILARECYLRASEIDPSAQGVVEQARKRLDLMAEVSRTYRREG